MYSIHFQELTLFIFQCTSRCSQATCLLYHILFGLSSAFFDFFQNLFLNFQNQYVIFGSAMRFTLSSLADNYYILPHHSPFVNTFFLFFLPLLNIFSIHYILYLFLLSIHIFSLFYITQTNQQKRGCKKSPVKKRG